MNSPTGSTTTHMGKVIEMEFVKWLVQDVLSDSITWIAVAGILVCWTLGALDIVKYGWRFEKEGN